MKLTFPHMGNTYIVAKAMLDDLNVDYVIPPYNNRKALEIGTKYAPELACLPLKINLGNFLQAREQGADSILITGGCGPCRFGFYCEMHRQILQDIGAPMDVITLEAPDGDAMELLRRVRKIAGKLKPIKLLRATRGATLLAKELDEMEMFSYTIRPREQHKGTTDGIYSAFGQKAMETGGTAAMRRLVAQTKAELKQVVLDRNIQPLRVGVVGEIFTTNDPFSNLNLYTALGNMGIEARREVTVSGWIIEHMLKKAMHLPRDLRFVAAAKPYLGAMIGGHAQETVGHAVMYAQQGYDGIIQIYPLSCMPEIVAQSILPTIERDFDIPILTLIIDEMTGEAGYMTRVEAFADLLRKRRERKAVEGNIALSGN